MAMRFYAVDGPDGGLAGGPILVLNITNLGALTNALGVLGLMDPDYDEPVTAFEKLFDWPDPVTVPAETFASEWVQLSGLSAETLRETFERSGIGSSRAENATTLVLVLKDVLAAANESGFLRYA